MEGSIILHHLFSVAVRATGLMALAWVAIGILRVRSAGARHAVWTLAAGAMIALAALEPLMPRIPMRLLNPATPIANAVALPLAPAAPVEAIVQRAVAGPGIPWQIVAFGIYLAGACWFLARLAYGYLFTLRMLRAARPVEPGIMESDWVAVPVTVESRIVLPQGWQQWDTAKRLAVLAHERAHVHRRDWAVALLAAVNRSVYWFHPGAWWMERRVASLAELACDDAALGQVGSREAYAQALVEIAAAVRPGKGRVVWEAMAMAKVGEVRVRVERILDETRELSRGVSRWRWVAMAACVAPVVWLVSTVHLARVEAAAVEIPEAQAAAPTAAPAATPDSPQAGTLQRLLELDQQITSFKMQNMGGLPEHFQANVAQLQSLQMAVGAANEAVGQLQRNKLMLETQLQNNMMSLSYHRATMDRATTLLVQLESLRKEFEKARNTYTENHPTVKELQSNLLRLEQEFSAERANPTQPDTQKSVRDLENAIATIKTEIQNINLQMEEKIKQVQEMNRQISHYQRQIESGPELEQRYVTLMRVERTETVRAEPFEAVELAVGTLFGDDPPG
jgi:beta-lactamase regulating signal transducer with metallopeptidase domain/predicted  nucleic acid-binding Zn-ribbon protein